MRKIGKFNIKPVQEPAQTVAMGIDLADSNTDQSTISLIDSVTKQIMASFRIPTELLDSKAISDFAAHANEQVPVFVTRRVALDAVGDITVSTMYLGMYYETMIFGGKHDSYQRRCGTLVEAQKHHAAAIIMVTKTCNRAKNRL